MSNTLEHAEKSFAFCKKYLEHEDYENARLFCLNAMMHDSNILYLKTYLLLLKRLKNPLRKIAVEEAINLYQMALFQVSADDLLTVKELLEKLEEMRDDYFELGSDTSAAKDIALQEVSKEPHFVKLPSWEALRNDGSIQDTNIIQQRVATCQQLMGQDDSERYKRELQESLEYLDFLTKQNIISGALQETEEELSKVSSSLGYIASRLQNVTTILQQMWLLNVNPSLGKLEARKLLEKFTQQLESQEQRYWKKQSEPLFRELKSKLKEAHFNCGSFSSSRYSARISAGESIMREVSSRLAEISFDLFRKELQAETEKLGKKVLELSKRRYAKYQEEVARLSEQAIIRFDQTTIVTAAVAKEILETCKISQIDESFLAPETSAIYHSAKTMLMDKLSCLEKARFQVDCVKASKITLEDF